MFPGKKPHIYSRNVISVTYYHLVRLHQPQTTNEKNSLQMYVRPQIFVTDLCSGTITGSWLIEIFFVVRGQQQSNQISKQASPSHVVDDDFCCEYAAIKKKWFNYAEEVQWLNKSSTEESLAFLVCGEQIGHNWSPYWRTVQFRIESWEIWPAKIDS